MTLTLRMTSMISTVQSIIPKVDYSGLATLKTVELLQDLGKRYIG